MLPNPLKSLYLKHKQETNWITWWLAHTAIDHEYPPVKLQCNSAKSQPLSAKSRHSKDKIRKKAHRSATSPPTRRRYLFPKRCFEDLAQHLESKKVPVPKLFISVLDRVIKSRLDYSAQLATLGRAGDSASNDRHEDFVKILQQVRVILLGISTPTTVTDGYGTRDLVDDATELQPPSWAASDGVIYELEQPTSLEDVLFAFGLMVDDLNRIRSRIKWIWSNYQSGVFDVVAAAVATDTAINLARQIIDEVVPMTADHGGCWKVANLLFRLLALGQDFSEEDLHIYHPSGDDFNYDLFDLGVDTFLLAHRHIEAFVRTLVPGSLPIYKDGACGWYDANSNRDTMTGRQKFQEDQSLLMPFLSELMLAVQLVDDYPIEDEFILGMEQIHLTGRIPFYVAFAAQVFLDIHHVLRGDATKAYDTIRAHMVSFQVDIRKHITFHENLKILNWGPANDAHLMEMLKRLDDLIKDPIYQVKATLSQQSGKVDLRNIERNRILKMSPILSGLMLFRLRMEQKAIGTAVATAWGSIMYSAHLQHALQSEEFVSDEWRDMMAARCILGESSFFAGNPPTNPAEYMRQYAMKMGFLVSVLPESHRGSDSLISALGPRGIDGSHSAPVSSMFHGRYLGGPHQFVWTEEQISMILERCDFKAVGSEEEGTLECVQMDEAERRAHAKAKETSVVKGGNPAVTHDTAVSPDQLIHKLTLALHAEQARLAFPWLTMHRSCWDFLRTVRRSCDAHLTTMHGPAYLEEESQLPIVVGYILSEAFEGDMRLMRLAAAGADRFYKGSGSRVLEKLEKLGVPMQFLPE